MPGMTPEEFVEKWGRRLRGATVDIRKGVDRVTTAPSEEAIAAKEKLKARLIEAIDKGVWEKMLREYSLEDWKKDMKETGISRISSGVDKAEDKMRKFGEWLLRTVAEGQAKVERMPNVTLDDSVRRAETFIRHMAENRYKKP